MKSAEYENTENPGSERLARILNTIGLVTSNKDGARMISQGAVKINDEVFDDENGEVLIKDLNDY